MSYDKASAPQLWAGAKNKYESSTVYVSGADYPTVGALIDAGNRQGGPFWFWKGVNPRAAAAAAMGAVIPLADFIAAAATGASGAAAAGAVGVEALVAPGVALARGATLGAVVSSVGAGAS